MAPQTSRLLPVMLLLLILTLVSSLAAAAPPDGLQVPAAVLMPGMSYTFRYRSTTTTTPPNGGVEDSTGLEVACMAALQVGTANGTLLAASLRLSHAHFFHRAPASASSGGSSDSLEDEDAEAALTRAPVAFTLDTATGRLVHLHVDAHDPLWAANIKRAIVALLQWQPPTEAEIAAAVDTYHRDEDDIVGTCRVAHRLQAEPTATGGLLRSHKLRRAHLDCDWRSIDHGRTHVADRSRLSRFQEGSTVVRHVFNHTSGHVLKIRFEDVQSAVLQGDPRQRTRATSNGYLALTQVEVLPAAHPINHTSVDAFTAHVTEQVGVGRDDSGSDESETRGWRHEKTEQEGKIRAVLTGIRREITPLEMLPLDPITSSCHFPLSSFFSPFRHPFSTRLRPASISS